MSYSEMHDVFAHWNQGKLDSYLIEITRDILAYKDEDGEPLLEKILDSAGQKAPGAGQWTRRWRWACADIDLPKRCWPARSRPSKTRAWKPPAFCRGQTWPLTRNACPS